VPAFVAEHALDDPDFGRSWLPTVLPDLIEALAAARQLVFGLSYWTAPGSPVRNVDTSRGGYPDDDELDWSLPWDQLVELGRDWALRAAAGPTTSERRARREREDFGDAVVLIHWIDESDR
jgi:hypothetical protein